MTLPAAAPERQPKHRRSIDVQVYSRGNGLWEVDAVLVDVKPRDVPMVSGLRPAGTPIHDMLLRIVVNEQFEIVAAGSETRWMPYPGHCDDHGDAYVRLVGLNLMQGFRQALRERFKGVHGCTHLTELAQVLPTAVVQAMAGEVIDTRGHGQTKPYQIDRCHALRHDGEAVRLYYPRWHRSGAAAHHPREES
jgi:hypothetical protein